jgi:hypothetical protein
MNYFLVIFIDFFIFLNLNSNLNFGGSTAGYRYRTPALKKPCFSVTLPSTTEPNSSAFFTPMEVGLLGWSAGWPVFFGFRGSLVSGADRRPPLDRHSGFLASGCSVCTVFSPYNHRIK